MNGTFVQNVHNLNPDVDFIFLDTDLNGLTQINSFFFAEGEITNIIYPCSSVSQFLPREAANIFVCVPLCGSVADNSISFCLRRGALAPEAFLSC